MFCNICECFHNPNTRCCCYRDKDKKVLRRKKSETEEQYLSRVIEFRDNNPNSYLNFKKQQKGGLNSSQP